MKEYSMRGLMTLVVTAVFGAAVAGQVPATKEMKAFVVAVEEGKLTLSNVQLGGAGGGQTFVMPAPKEGAPPPSWVAAAPGAAEGGGAPPPKMMMVTQASDSAPLVLTEFITDKGAVKAADFPRGTHVTVTYREADGKKWLQKIERVATK